MSQETLSKCPRCGQVEVRPDTVLFTNPDPNADDLVIMANGFEYCRACGWDESADEVRAAVEKARKSLDFCSHARRKYRHDQTVSEAVSIPFRVWVELQRCMDSPSVRAIDLIFDVLAVLVNKTPSGSTVSSTALVKIPSRAVLDAGAQWEKERAESNKTWDARGCRDLDFVASGKWCKECPHTLCHMYKHPHLGSLQ